MNKAKLRSIMMLHGEDQNKLAKVVGLSPQRFSSKINEKSGAEFSQSEIKKIKIRYNLTAEDIDDIFFSHFVS